MKPKFRRFYNKSLYEEFEPVDKSHCIKYDGNYRLSVQEQVDRFIYYGHNLEASRKKPLVPLDSNMNDPSKAWSPLEDPYSDIMDKHSYVKKADEYLKGRHNEATSLKKAEDKAVSEVIEAEPNDK